jgi:type I restriction enzyme R subunit
VSSDLSEKALESLIVDYLTTESGSWLAGDPKDYDREYAVDLAQLSAFLKATQPKVADALDLDHDSPTRQKFLARLQGEITKRASSMSSAAVSGTARMTSMSSTAAPLQPRRDAAGP